LFIYHGVKAATLNKEKFIPSCQVAWWNEIIQASKSIAKHSIICPESELVQIQNIVLEVANYTTIEQCTLAVNILKIVMRQYMSSFEAITLIKGFRIQAIFKINIQDHVLQFLQDNFHIQGSANHTPQSSEINISEYKMLQGIYNSKPFKESNQLKDFQKSAFLFLQDKMLALPDSLQLR